MTIDFTGLEEYLIQPVGKEGYYVAVDCPQSIKDELIELDEIYFDTYGTHLITIL
jgi:hypothetical protein